MRILFALSIVAAAAIQPVAAQARQQSAPPKIEPQYFSTDWMPNTRPRDPHADQKGRVWFVGQTGNYVGQIDPRTGAVKRFEIDPGTNPHNLVVAKDGQIWFTGNRNNRLVKMDPETGKLTTYLIPDESVRDPHTMIFDQKGNAWFTAQDAAVVGRFIPSSGEFKLWKTAPGSRPYGIVIDSRGRPWFDLFGTNRIGTIDPATLQMKEYVLPAERARPRRIAVTSDGGVWYGDYTRGYLGRLDPATGKVEEYALPSGAMSLPYGMAVDDQDRVWVAETGVQPNRLVSFDTKKRLFQDQIAIGEGNRNSIRHMTFDPLTRMIWFGEDRGFVSGIKVPAVIVP